MVFVITSYVFDLLPDTFHDNPTTQVNHQL